jgi:hypothetical protein
MRAVALSAIGNCTSSLRERDWVGNVQPVRRAAADQPSIDLPTERARRLLAAASNSHVHLARPVRLLQCDIWPGRIWQLCAVRGAERDDPMAEAVVDWEDQRLSIDDDGDPTQVMSLEELQTLVLRDFFEIGAHFGFIHGILATCSLYRVRIYGEIERLGSA